MNAVLAGYTGSQGSFLDECWTCASPAVLGPHGHTGPQTMSDPVDPKRTPMGRVHNSLCGTRTYGERTREAATCGDIHNLEPDDGVDLALIGPRDAADIAVLEWADGLRESYRPRSRVTERIAGVPDGWLWGSWQRRLLTLADACQCVNPGRAAELRAKAKSIRQKVDTTRIVCYT